MNSKVTLGISELESILKPHGQEHVLQFWDSLNDREQNQLASQIESIDFERLTDLARVESSGDKWAELASQADLPPAITLEHFRSPEKYAAAQAAGQAALKAGKVGMILVAGGQGSRLGFEHPKGMFPIGPLSERTLYQIVFEHVLARARQFETTIPMYMMTSPPTHDESTEFVESNQHFGFAAEDVVIFCQGVMPAVDHNGRLLLSGKGEIFVSPDGHGGTVAALDKNDCFADMKRRGIEYVFYGQIDNPLMQACDPALIGFHILNESEMTTQVVRKNDPLQKVGNVVSINDKVQIIEYSDLPDRYASQTNPDGSLKLWAGSIAVHVFNVEFLTNSLANSEALPFHQAQKKVPFLNADGNLEQPTQNNAVKFEKFIFDMLPFAKNAIVCEVDPADGFCAVKNAPPAKSETPEHVRTAIVALHTRWLVAAGVNVAPGVSVEINPSFAVDANELVAIADQIDDVTESRYFQ